jgi:hypothetical protein
MPNRRRLLLWPYLVRGNATPLAPGMSSLTNPGFIFLASSAFGSKTTGTSLKTVARCSRRRVQASNIPSARFELAPSLRDSELGEEERIVSVPFADAVVASAGAAVAAVHVNEKHQGILVGLQRSQLRNILGRLPVHYL